MIKRLILLLIFLWRGGTYARDATDIVRKIEDSMRGESSYGEMEMLIVKKEWTRKLRLRFWEMGKEKVVVVILEPAKERGLATLKIGKNVLNYIPSIERTIKLPPSMMNESWMGSHFTNDDLVRESSLERDYYSELVKEDSQRYYIELKPKPDSAVIWGKVEMEVEKGTYIPLKVHFYNEKGERVRRIIYSNLKKIGKRAFPFLWSLYPEGKEGEKTEIKFLEIKLDIPINEEIFTVRKIQKLLK